METPEHREAPIRVHFGAGLHAAAGQPVDAAAYEQYLGRWSRLFVPAVLAAAEVARGDRVLDVATGPGEAALVALATVTPAGRVIGADISPAMLTAARARLGAGAFQPVPWTAKRWRSGMAALTLSCVNSACSFFRIPCGV